MIKVKTFYPEYSEEGLWGDYKTLKEPDQVLEEWLNKNPNVKILGLSQTHSRWTDHHYTLVYTFKRSKK